MHPEWEVVLEAREIEKGKCRKSSFSTHLLKCPESQIKRTTKIPVKEVWITNQQRTMIINQ